MHIHEGGVGERIFLCGTPETEPAVESMVSRRTPHDDVVSQKQVLAGHQSQGRVESDPEFRSHVTESRNIVAPRPVETQRLGLISASPQQYLNIT